MLINKNYVEMKMKIEAIKILFLEVFAALELIECLDNIFIHHIVLLQEILRDL